MIKTVPSIGEMNGDDVSGLVRHGGLLRVCSFNLTERGFRVCLGDLEV